MSSKSLPSSFKHNNRSNVHNSSTISRVTIEGSNSSDIDHGPSAQKDMYSSSFSSSNVKISSPLARPAWYNEANTVHTDSSGTASDKSWMTRRWSTVSGSLKARRKNKKSTASRLWTNRQKRRTFPPSTDILIRDRKKFALLPAVPPIINKKHYHRQSLQDILTTFYKYDDPSSSGVSSNVGNDSDSAPTSSSSTSKKLGRILKKKGKQPLKKPILTVNTNSRYTEEELKAAMMSMFQPPATISSKSSTPSSPLRFPTPPKRFSAYYVDSQGKSGRVDYKAKMGLSNYLINVIQHGVFSSSSIPHSLPKEPSINEKTEDQYREYNKELLLNASLFLFGFVFFPFWWIGTWLYFKRRKQLETDELSCKVYHDSDLFSIKTIAYLNSIFSCLSFVLVAVILSLVIWLVKA
ncbi:hypothetical protein [Parasitella parasitica]|uniref:Uncharacterized protein n=1 Tax=Parasitella parasitica TaxID=35722 RepID=A0A0B7MYK8_9FUNG|nr:hypothetical protein [Parasitella parasitica]